MIPEIGSIYEKHAVVESGFRLERRRVLDANDTQVLYEIVLDPPEGTHVELMPERKQVGIKDWKLWAKTASISEV